MILLTWATVVFLVASLLYLALAYALRWYEVTNHPEYWLKYGNRTIFKSGWHGPALFAQEYLLLIIHLLMLVADWLLLPYYYWRGEQSGLISDKSTNAPSTTLDSNPVIFVHGYMMRCGTFWLLRRRLRKDGRRVWFFNYGPPTHSIAPFAQQLKEHIEKVLAESGRKKVDIIGHSMGGLVILYYLNKLGGDKRVENMITLGTPFAGSKLWAFSIGNCGRQMRPDSDFLQELDTTRISPQVKLTAIYSDFDELVIPNENARANIPGAINKKVSGIGHVGLIFSDTTYTLIKEALQIN